MFLTATPQGYRRKIGPRSRYGTTPDGPAYERTPQRVGMSPQRVGSKTAGSGIDAHFGSMAGRVQQEKNERETADRFLADKERRRSNEARRNESKPKSDAVVASVEAGLKGGPLGSALSGFLSKVRADSEAKTRATKQAADRAKGRAKALMERTSR